ncbi:unnamed protein product [Hydatigera taeniaeformis]|uniref:Secreted protein n=1 Tax=Hydatigena taeniaeformis TaxID=6205 RepID=A0A0R3XCM5_HYDTA|nr:unnamed protein product [Hydatigera taeniaeformis]
MCGASFANIIGSTQLLTLVDAGVVDIDQPTRRFGQLQALLLTHAFSSLLHVGGGCVVMVVLETVVVVECDAGIRCFDDDNNANEMMMVMVMMMMMMMMEE